MPQEMHPAPLPQDALEHRLDGLLEALVGLADDQEDPV
jgi:hypothetical protein